MIFSFVWPSIQSTPSPNKNALDFPHPFQGEGRGGDGVDCMYSACFQNQPHPHPNLPLEGEGTKSSKLAHMGTEGGLFWTVFKLLTGDA